MIKLAVIIAIISIIEIRSMSKKNSKKEIAVFISLAVIAFGLGLIYFPNPYRNSISYIMLNLIGKKF